ncbi:MAG: hypothetical protein U1F10_16450 [Burkholderiales bacterium]
MTNYNPVTKWTDKLAIVAVTVVIGLGTLQWVAGAMTCPDAESIALRRQVIAAQEERSQQIRALQNGEVRLATSGAAAGL